MSFLRSKHSGWTWEGKRTPFGGGNPIAAVTDPISKALGTDGSGGGVLGGLAQLDKSVNNAIPGGWVTVGALTAGGLALAYAPEVMAFAEANGLTPAAASTQLGIAPVDAATGQVVSSDVFAGLSANAPVDTTLSQQAAASMGIGSAAADSSGAIYDATSPGFVGPSGTPDIAAANQAAQANAIYDASTPGFVGPTGTADVAAADQAAAAQAGYSPMQVAQAAAKGISVAKLLQGAGTALGIVPAAANLFGGGLKGTGATSATDPYAQYRPQAAQQLNQLMNQPSAALSQPGYQQTLTEGLKQAQRGAAATGQLQSGAEMAALQSQGQNVFGSYYNTLLGNLMQMSGASANPASAQTAAQQIAASKQNMLNQNLGTLTSGIGSIASLYNSGGTSDPYANAQNAISQYGASNVYGYGGSGVAGSAAGIDPNVQQF
jgi:hypothetical protein